MLSKFSVAPMMDWTDKHCRYFHRLLTRHTLLYTEMVTTGAVIHGNREKLLGFSEQEHPVALQLGGSVPAELAQSARVGAEFGYDEINLNVGCPSDRVQSGRFGACLMAEPQLVADGVAAMRADVDIPVTVKTRIGIDDKDSYEELVAFISCVAESGCTTFIIHARKAWLQGLSPKQNREIPPLSYSTVYQLKRDFPQLKFVINGGITDLQQTVQHLQQIDGVMLGRAAYQNPALLAEIDNRFFTHVNSSETLDRYQIIEQLIPYIEQQCQQGIRLHAISRHILGLFQGQPGAKAWRRYISENAHKRGAGVEVIAAALAKVAEAESRVLATLND